MQILCDNGYPRIGIAFYVDFWTEKIESGASGTAYKNGVQRSGERRLFAAREDWSKNHVGSEAVRYLI